MKNHSIVAAWYQLTGHDLRLYEQLSYYERVYGVVFPSQKTLAFRLKCSVRTVRRSIKHLKLLGLLKVRARKYQDRLGRWRSHSNVYKLCGFLGAKMRGILARLTERPRLTSHTKTSEKEELFGLFTFNHITDPEAKNLLEQWMERGGRH
jgi:DNA-binding transcriptional MocR family regulator